MAFSKEVQIVNELGLHARAAAKLAKIASRAEAGIWLEKNGQTVDATSVIDILTLACAKGSYVKVTIAETVDTAVHEDIVRLIKCGFEEE